MSLASLIIAAGALSFTYWQLLICRRQTRILNSHRIAATSAVQKSRMDLLEVRNRARLLEDTVSSGASAVEKLHRSISNTTFVLIDLFSRDEAFQQNARNAQKTHDQTSQQIYRAVRTTNKALHILADTLIISKAEKKIVSRKTVSKKAPRER
ncbi:hypothetical protein BKP64_05425 [Marinobacter salinus]|uniref:Uncharacterized protein n=1 Tax=Marinobacter salinus TaxID=1874317 RepID=A0A1D9GRB7_9GAMM|nr:hypothetical protein BKP64_05425 [Marinobacter salinus]